MKKKWGAVVFTLCLAVWFLHWLGIGYRPSGSAVLDLKAKNAGIKTVIVPAENKADIKELSEEITKGLEIVYVSHMDEVLKTALVPGKGGKGKNHGN